MIERIYRVSDAVEKKLEKYDINTSSGREDSVDSETLAIIDNILESNHDNELLARFKTIKHNVESTGTRTDILRSNVLFIVENCLNDFCDMMDAYSGLQIDGGDYRTKIFVSYIVDTILQDSAIASVTTLSEFINYLISKRYDIIIENKSFVFSFESFVLLCCNYNYHKSIYAVCEYLIEHIITNCTFSSYIDLSVRLNVISHFVTIYRYLQDITGKTGMAGMFSKFEKIRDSKITDFVDAEQIDMVATVAKDFLGAEGHGDFGEEFSDIIKDAASQQGMEKAVKTMFNRLKEKQGIVADVSESLLSRYAGSEENVKGVFDNAINVIRKNGDQSE